MSRSDSIAFHWRDLTFYSSVGTFQVWKYIYVTRCLKQINEKVVEGDFAHLWIEEDLAGYFGTTEDGVIFIYGLSLVTMGEVYVDTITQVRNW
jgi:hypothetical protein